ncbi:hypothetical protein [Microbacterium sp. T32]|uniref:hypothetical protein n=1 Tax=Microbacterium sp. T32 TaxID=1776083 RepID=UPI0007AB8142|nr:hypothetical protein [Microbacterium sp. T32]KZE42482.1 hypothetical protein AVW09_10155 [Microbacterium sp. T32]
MRTPLRAVHRAIVGGRFVTRWTFVAIAAMSLTVLAPLPAEISGGERALVATATAAVFALAWGLVAVAERAARRTGVRATIVVGALVLTALARPALQDAVSRRAGLPVASADELPLRAATNLLAWAITLIGTAALVDVARSTRETNALLAQVLAQWNGSAERVHRYTADARAAIRAAADALETAQPETVDDVRALASALRVHARDLADRAAAPPSHEVDVAAPLQPARTRSVLRLPPIGVAAMLYALAVLPYALRSVPPVALGLGLVAGLLCGTVADLVSRLRPLARRPRVRGGVFAAASVLVGAVLSAIAAVQGVSLPIAAVPILAYPALALALARGRGALHALGVERRRLSSAIAARGRADDLGTRRVRAGLHRAADLVHADAQGAAVHFALRHPDATPDEVASFRAGLAPLADAVRGVLDAPAPTPEAVSLTPLLRTWGVAMPVDAEIDADAGDLLRNDAALARDVVDVVAEGLLNAAKHARRRAARVEVHLRATAAGPRLRVRVISSGAPGAGAHLRTGSRADRLGAHLTARGDDAVLEALFLVADAPGSVVSTEHSAGGSERRA